MRYSYFLLASSLAAGAILFAFTNHYLIFTGFSHESSMAYDLIHRAVAKKKVKLFTVYENSWQEEEQEILWPYEPLEQARSLVEAWLAFIAENSDAAVPVKLQAVLMSTAILYLSFDRAPFEAHLSSFDKLMWVESLLKTLRENGMHNSAVQILVNHQLFADPHLDCSRSWPMSGFLPA